MPVTIYTKTTCAPCQAVKHWFKSKNIKYTEVNADIDPTVPDKVFQLSGFLQFPCVVIGDNVVSGMNFARLNQLLTN